MYRQIVHFLQGQVLVRIECGCPERVLNLCGARGIPFWELTWESPVCLTLRAVGRDLPRLRQAAEDAGGSLHLCRSGGVPVFWRRLRRRYVLLAGAVLALVLMFGGNLVIWDFQVSGNDTVPTETILRALEDYGITVGSPGLHIDQETMRNHVLLALPEVSWLAVNVRRRDCCPGALVCKISSVSPSLSSLKSHSAIEGVSGIRSLNKVMSVPSSCSAACRK